MPTVAGVAARIEREGEPVTLKRAGQPDLPTVAFVRGYRAEELVGNVEQGDREARMSNRDIEAFGWPGPPRKGDQLMIAGRTVAVKSCATTTLRGAVAMHVLQVTG